MVSIPTSPISHSARASIFWALLPVGAAIVVVLAISWTYVFYMVWGMANMDGAADALLMPGMSYWSTKDILLAFVMWAIMMTAMMLPSAAPLLLLLARINHERYSRQRAFLVTGVFGLGYLAVWTGFSLLATLAQWSLLGARLSSPMMGSASAFLSAALFAAAGAYQFTALKHSCLSRCRSPLGVLMTDRSEGMWGAFLMGLRQGMYCAGGCWLLMTLLFVFGVMNLVWIAGLSLLVLVEKLLRQPRWFVQVTGAILLIWGALIAGRTMLLWG